MATASRTASTEHGAEVARALGWPADRVGVIGALGGLVDVGASMRRPRSVASLLVRRRVKQLRDIEARMHAEQRAFAVELAHTRETPARRRAVRAAEALTPSERHVAELAQRGLTNLEIAQALFVSTKTVEFHLRNTYVKLRIGSRGELARALRVGDKTKGAAEPAQAPHGQY